MNESQEEREEIARRAAFWQDMQAGIGTLLLILLYAAVLYIASFKADLRQEKTNDRQGTTARVGVRSK